MYFRRLNDFRIFMITAKGTLIPIGGNEDKGADESESTTLEYIQEGILSRVVQESGGTDALIVIIPTASSIPVEVCKTYIKAFEKLGCTNLYLMDIRSRKDAERPEYLELIAKADCVMFSGGNQSRIVKFIGKTRLSEIIMNKYLHEHFVIAGTSAGAMCMSENMITGGGYRETLLKDSVLTGQGMGFIPELVIDSHFIRRRRFGRLVEAVATYPNRVGIGLAENTGLIIKNKHHCEVIGSGMMILFDPREVHYNNLPSVQKGHPISITNLKTHILASGDKLIIGSSKIKFQYADREVLKLQ